jgi:hypothetical protein
MNYFAHGIPFIANPHFLAGTAVPDWLNVVDRKIRVRADDVRAFADGSGSPSGLFAEGILQHLADDEWFHATRGFELATREMTDAFREHLSKTEENPRAAFLGHITTELLLDRVLIETEPRRLDDYYASLASVDPAWIENTLGWFLDRPVSGLASFIERFLEARFLFDYLDASKLIYRLNQVTRRIKLRPLTPNTTGVIESGREIVERRLPELLPAEHFPFPQHLEDHR